MRCVRAMTLALGLSLAGCQTLSMPALFGAGEAPAPETLATLTPASVEPAASTRAQVDRQQVIDDYEALLPLLDDPQRIVQVRHRLADLRFRQAEDRLAESATGDLSGAIQAYERLLEQYPARPNNDQVLYQLAKAHALNADTTSQLATLNRLVEQYPDSAFWAEAQFRRGEILFSDRRFAESQQAFEAVISSDQALADQQDFLSNAWYMKGWSQFKQGHYRPALRSYVQVLDSLLPDRPSVAQVGQAQSTLVEDLFRVMGLSFTYLDGAETVPALFREVGPRPYEVLVYDRYGKLLLDKEQYTDAIKVYQRYIDSHPMDRFAPRFHMRIIDTLALARFDADIPARKAAFVDNYGITSTYWDQGEDLDYVRSQLESLLPELADRHYVAGQQAKQPRQTRQEYQTAARYYAEFVNTFPQHPRAPERLFLLAETRLKLRQWPQAIRAFERVAYDYPGNARAAEAGYASVLAYRQYARTWADEPAAVRQARAGAQQQSRMRFVDQFPDDPRAVDVLYVATRYEFEQQAYPTVVARASQIVAWQPPPDSSLILEASLLKAHSLYAMADYPAAEIAYQTVLERMPANDERYSAVVDNLAASVYRQGEAKLAAGDSVGAVDQLLRVGVVAPTSTLRANAEYDAASTLIELKDWSRAIAVITDFRQRYPTHEKIATLPAKMALAYRETGQWALAADELQTMAAMATTEQERRETLLMSAELYDRSGRRDKTIASYRDYANRYPEPLGDFMESAHRLAELYQQGGESDKRRFWLKRQMDAVDAHSGQVDDRMVYLAAQASSVLASDAWETYQGIELTLPLQTTLPAKTSALATAVKAYQKTASYGVAEYATEAGYRIADLYAQLSTDLMDAERPPGLSELEQSQYDLLLEEQAFPFEEKAIDIHEQNARRSWNGLYDEWVRKSFDALKSLLPARYNKPEQVAEVIDELG